MSDTDLLRRCIAGERPAWEELVRQHATVMFAMALRVLPSGGPGGAEAEAEDVVQAVFLKLWEDGRRRLRSFRGRSRLSTWLAAVTRREALDRLRREKRERDRDAAAGHETLERLRDELRNGTPSPQEAAATAQEQTRAFVAAVDRLPPRDRLLVRLVYGDGCSYREAAGVLQASENSIGPWLRRAQERLRESLTPETKQP